MADPFYEPLPAPGQTPWSLNGPIQEIRERIGDVDDFISSDGIAQAIAEAAATLNPEALSDGFIATQLEDTGSATGQAFRRDLPVYAATYGVSRFSADNKAALDTAISLAATLKVPVVLPGGVLKTSALNPLPAGTSLRGAGKGITILDYLPVPGGALFTLNGSRATTDVAVTANVSRDDATITVASTAGMAVDDIYVIRDDYSYTPTDATYKSGEQVRVASILSGTQFTIRGAVRGSYAPGGGYTIANSTKITKLTFAEGLSLSDLSIRAPQTVTAGIARLNVVRGVTITNVSILEAGSFGFLLYDCRDVGFTNVSIKDMPDNLVGGFNGYGISANGSTENLVINGGQFSRMRHAFTTMGGVWGMPHNVTITGATFSEHTSAAVDTHAAGENFVIAVNTFSQNVQHVTVRARNVMVANNLMNGSTSHAINVAETNTFDTTIIGNRISKCGATGINVRDYGNSIYIRENTLTDITQHGIAINGSFVNVYVMNNYIRNVSLSGSLRRAIVSTVNGGTEPTDGGTWWIADNTVHQSAAGAYGAIDMIAGGTVNVRAYDNKARGTFSGDPYTLTTATSDRNWYV